MGPSRKSGGGRTVAQSRRWGYHQNGKQPVCSCKLGVILYTSECTSDKIDPFDILLQ